MDDLYRNPFFTGGNRDNAVRISQSRLESLGAAADRAEREPAHAGGRWLVQIFDGGNMPTAPDHFFLAYPLELDGVETEDGTASPTADSNPIAVDVVGHVPSVGDILVAYAVGGRWVAESKGTGGISPAPCTPCAIPREDLTISWTNLISGPGSVTMSYTASPNVWKTGCIDGQIYELLCSSGTIELAVTYFISGFCPTGQSQFCSNLRVYPFGLVMSSYTCSPFSVTFIVAPGCPEVEAPGYTSFTITL